MGVVYGYIYIGYKEFKLCASAYYIDVGTITAISVLSDAHTHTPLHTYLPDTHFTQLVHDHMSCNNKSKRFAQLGDCMKLFAEMETLSTWLVHTLIISAIE